MSVDPVTQGVRRGAAVFGFLKAWRMNRRRKKRLKELGIPEEESMAIETGLRSSSNMVIAGGVTNILIEVVQMFWPEFVLSPEMRVNLTLAIAWVASRFTKTPVDPKVV